MKAIIATPIDLNSVCLHCAVGDFVIEIAKAVGKEPVMDLAQKVLEKYGPGLTVPHGLPVDADGKLEPKSAAIIYFAYALLQLCADNTLEAVDMLHAEQHRAWLHKMLDRSIGDSVARGKSNGDAMPLGVIEGDFVWDPSKSYSDTPPDNPPIG